MEPPDDWETFAEAVERLSIDGRYGFLMSAIAGNRALFRYCPRILSAGETYKRSAGGNRKGL